VLIYRNYVSLWTDGVGKTYTQPPNICCYYIRSCIAV
jgi:hypothetical protein